MQWGLPWYTWAMKPPLFIRPLTDDERLQLEADRRTADACRVRRAQIVLASARRMLPKPLRSWWAVLSKLSVMLSMPLTSRG